MFMEREVKAFTRGRPGELLGAEGKRGNIFDCLVQLRIRISRKIKMATNVRYNERIKKSL